MRLLLLASRGGSSITIPAEEDMTDLGWINVRDYGATGDGTTDDTASISNAIAAVSTRGVLYFPPGTYKTSGGFTISVPMMVVGCGGGGGETLNYDGGGGTVGHISQITCTSQTAHLFTVSASGVQFHDLSMRNTFAGTPSAGSAIRTTTGGGDHAQYSGLTMVGFYVNLDHGYGREYMIDRCYSLDPVTVGMYLRNSTANDVLEVSVTQCQFMQQIYANEAQIKLTRGGGIRIADCLFFALGPSNLTSPVVGVKADMATATSNLSITGCHFENYTDIGIYVTGSASTSINNLIISGNEILDGRATAKQAIYVNKGYRVSITGNVLVGTDQAYNAITLDNTTHAVIVGNYWESFAGFQGGSGNSDVNATANYGAS